MKRFFVLAVFSVFSLLGMVSCTSLQPKLGLNIILDTGYSHSSVLQNLPQNWQDGYYPPGGSMGTEVSNYDGFLELGLALEPKFLINKKWEIGFPISYQFLSCGNSFATAFPDVEKTIASTDLDWWDPVTLLEVRVRKTSPAIGISAHYLHWKAQFSLQQYELFKEDFRGIDVIGAPNGSIPVGRRDYERGLGQRFDLSCFPDPSGEGWSPGIYFERNGNSVWIIGVNLTYVFNLLD